MKKTTVIYLILFLSLTSVYAQSPLGKGGRQFNAGVGISGFGIPIYAGLDFGVHPDITVGPQLSYRRFSERFGIGNVSHSITVLGFNGNYHFDRLLDLPKDVNVYAGLTAGYYIWSSPSNYVGTRASGIGIDAQVGARYFISKNFGLNVELGGGTSTGGKFGITYIF